MQSTKLYIIILCLVFSNNLYAQKDIREESIYFLLTTRFFDGDTSNNRPTEWCSYFPGNPNNGNYSGSNDVTWKGDFKGLVQKLNYIKDLGFTAIWITPIVQNRSPLDYHGYHAWDFTKVDPRLESPGYTFKNLIDSAHAKGIKIFLDVVLNHAGRFGIKGRSEIKYNTDPNQPWGKKSNGSALTDNNNWQYDGKTPNPDDGKIWSRANIAKMPAPYNQNLAAYNWPGMESYVNTSDAAWFNKSGNGFAQGYDDTTNLYWRALAGDTPDFFTGGDSIRNYLFKAYKTFIDMGIDGMRLDAIKHMPKRDVLYFVDKFKQANPNLMFFGEVAQKRHELHQIEEINPHWYTWRGATKNSANSGLAVLDFFAMGTFHLFGKGEGYSGVKAAARYDDLYADPSTNVLFLDNHDFGPNNDWNKRYDGSPQNLAAALNFMFTWRGLPCVYYGTETQFMKGAYADIKSSNDINYSIDLTGRAYYGNELTNAPNHTIYKHIRKLNAIRKAVPALQKGSWRWDGTNDGNGVGFVRKFNTSEVAVGLAKDGTVTFNFSNLTNGTYKDAVTGNSINVTNGTISFTVSASSAGIYILNGPGMIGALGEGYFQTSSNGGGGTPIGGVNYNPTNPAPGTQLQVTYSGVLASQNQVVMHYSFDNWTKTISDASMVKQGNNWVTTVTVPSNASINFTAAFNNGNGTWDNNNGQDYKTNLGTGTIDNTPPLLSSLVPINGGVNILPGAIMTMMFNENIKKGSGNIVIYENNILKYNIDINSNQVSISNNALTINAGGFNSNASIYVLIANGVITDLVGNSFAGLTQNSQWAFTIGNSTNIIENKIPEFLIYPNPSNSVFFIAGDFIENNSNNVKIYNLLNQEIAFESLNISENVFKVNLTNASKGIYSVVIEYKGQKIFRKLVLN
jgi:glycosidase